MAKLGIIFKNKQEEWNNLEETELLTSIYNSNATLYIGTKEKRTLKEMAEGVQKELRRRTLLGKDEKIELSEFDRYIMEFEESKKQRVDSKIYNFCKMSYDAVEEGRITWEHLIELLEERRCSKCI